MKIKYVEGSLIDASEKYILHGCNAQGVMGAGVAKLIRAKWPSAYLAYKASKQHNGMRLGVITFASCSDGTVVFNGITQESYGWDSAVQYVDYWAVREVMQGMNFLAQSLDDYVDRVGVPSIAMPMIGAGLGGGDWDVISAIVEEEATNFQPVVYFLRKN